MKIHYFILLILLIFNITLVSAQGSGSSKTTFALLGGVNFQNLNGKDFNGDMLENDMIIGFHGGVNAQIPIAPEFYFQPGFMFTTKGAKQEGSNLSMKTSLSYLELPLNLVYKGAIGSGYVMVGFGPYIGYAINGKVTTDIGGTATVESNIVFKNEIALTDPLTTPFYKALDYGGNVFVGYEMANGIFALLNAQLGMAKINPEDNRFPTSKTSIKNTGFGFSLGYRF